jgi:hypothetical protein
MVTVCLRPRAEACKRQKPFYFNGLYDSDAAARGRAPIRWAVTAIAVVLVNSATVLTARAVVQPGDSTPFLPRLKTCYACRESVCTLSLAVDVRATRATPATRW